MCIQAYSCVRCAPHCLITTHDQHAVDMQPICSVRSMFDTDAPDFIGRSLVMPLALVCACNVVSGQHFDCVHRLCGDCCVVSCVYRQCVECMHWLCADYYVLPARSVGNVVY